MFGRRKREAAAAEAAREAERRALFAKLAERPEHICPFLGLAGERTGYVDGVSDEHRCFAFGDPAPLSAEQQTRVCQERGYGNCPRYLRGVLVIPTEELEALRRPHPAEPPPSARPRPVERRRRRVAPLLILVALIGAVGLSGGAAWVLLGGRGIAGLFETPSPSATATPVPTPTATPPATPTPEPTPSPTPTPVPPTPRPTPTLGDVFHHYQVEVAPDRYVLFDVSETGELVATREAEFSDFSEAPVEQVVAQNGLRHWRNPDGDYQGWSYVWPDSGTFEIWEVFLRPDGSFSYQGPLPAERL